MIMARSSSWSGRRPFTAVTGIRIPNGLQGENASIIETRSKIINVRRSMSIHDKFSP
jgi:hypothetical protein